MKFGDVIVPRARVVESRSLRAAGSLRFAQYDKNDVAMRGKDLRSRCFFTVAQA